jgi:hypothetical protein
MMLTDLLVPVPLLVRRYQSHHYLVTEGPLDRVG